MYVVHTSLQFSMYLFSRHKNTKNYSISKDFHLYLDFFLYFCTEIWCRSLTIKYWHSRYAIMTFTAHNTNRLTANALKQSITAYLISRDPSGIIGSEVMYGSSRRVADMVFISNGHSYAIEIKSEFDTTARLEGQLEEYQTLFDYIIIFSAPNHIDRINANIPDYVGLYSINKYGIQKLRREKINRHVQKSEMLISIPSAAVKTDFSVKGKLSSDEIRSVVLRKSMKEIHSYFITYFKEKLESSASRQKKKIPERIETSEDYIIV